MSSSILDQFRMRLLGSLGFTALACAPSPALDDEAGVTTDPSGSGTGSTSESGGTSSGTSTSTSTSTSESSGASTSEDEGPLDLDIMPTSDCTVTYADAGVLSEHPDCPLIDDPTSCGSQIYLGCTPLLGDGTCTRMCNGADCIGDWTTCAGDPIYSTPAVLCGPYEIEGQCCTIGQDPLPCSDGRPFVIGGEAVSRSAGLLAGPRLDGDEVAALPDEVRARSALRWRAVAQAEHASIASFARFTAELLARAAPPELVAAALQAMADEVRHAELARGVAEQLEGHALAFGPLDVSEAFTELEGDARVLACVREGCIGETLSALELAVAAERCSDPTLAAMLTAMAEDEARHATLAWRFVAWMLAHRPTLREPIAALFAGLSINVECPPEREVEPENPYALLDAGTRAALRHAALAGVLRPCVTQLIAA